jgi:hypothetical protein
MENVQMQGFRDFRFEVRGSRFEEKELRILFLHFTLSLARTLQ